MDWTENLILSNKVDWFVYSQSSSIYRWDYLEESIDDDSHIIELTSNIYWITLVKI